MRTRVCLPLLIIALGLPSVLSAQNVTPAQPVPTATPTRGVPPPEPPTLTANIQVEVSITDTAGGGAPEKKIVSMVVASGNMGRVRAQRGGAAVLNVDATPRVQNDGRIALQLSLEYRPREKVDTLEAAPINELLTVILQNGKPLIVTQAADPSSDRKVAVQVIATVLK